MLALSPLTPLLAIMPAKMGTMVLAWGSYDHDQPCQQCSTQLRYLDLCIRAYSWHRTKEAACPASTREEVMLLLLAKPDALPHSNPIAAELRHIRLLQNTIK